MKKLLILLLILIGSIAWLNNWVGSGRMDIFILQHENPVHTPKILFFIGETCRTLQQYKSAASYYKWLLKDYPDYPDAARVRWYLGQAYEDISKRDDALEQYEILMKSYPKSEYTEKASQRFYQIK